MKIEQSMMLAQAASSKHMADREKAGAGRLRNASTVSTHTQSWNGSRSQNNDYFWIVPTLLRKYRGYWGSLINPNI
jgi:hypothetical protein